MSQHLTFKITKILTEIPCYQQGDDMLCGFYAAVMFRIGIGGDTEYKKYFNTSKPYKINDNMAKSGMSFTTMSKLLAGVKYMGQAIQIQQIPNDKSAAWHAVIETLLKPEMPSVLWLPRSHLHPYGHYVLAKGIAVVKGINKTKCEDWLIINDPLQGERLLSKTEFEFNQFDFIDKFESQKAWVPKLTA